jgi:hypothetical protein
LGVVGRVLARTGDPDAAVRTYRALLDQGPPDAALALDAAETLLDNGHVERLGPLLRLAVDLARRSGDDAVERRLPRRTLRPWPHAGP